MTVRHVCDAGAAPLAFGERFARNAAIGAACLGLVTLMVVIADEDGRPLLLLVVAGVLLLSYWFRRRAMAEEQRRRRTLEDARDVRLQACGDRGFRIAASAWAIGLALALVVPGIRDILLAAGLRLPGMLLLGVVVANLAGHLAVAIAYARDR